VSDAEGNDNDDYVTDIRRIAYDKGTGFIYIFDEDGDEEAGGPVADPEDVYVFDPATGTIVYYELAATNLGFFNAATQVIFVRGDVTNDGSVDYDDIQAMMTAIADPTQGGKFSSEVGQEFFDLTGDRLLTDADLTELVESILGTTLGDFDVDVDVDSIDLDIWEAAFGDKFTGRDYLDWARNFGGAAPDSIAVPEPVGVVLVSLGLLSLVSCSRRRGE
jgi:hypothetical protein